MKTIFTFLFVTLSFCLKSYAQSTIPNSGFEAWTTFGDPPTDYQDPTDWKSTNGTVAFNATPVDKSTDSHTGTYAAEIKVTSVFGIIPSVILTNGTVPNDFSDYEINYDHAGTPVSIKPVSVSGYYKFTFDAASHDSAYAIVILKKWNTSTLVADTVGLGSLTFVPTSTYTHFSIPVNYSSVDMPDSIVVAFANKATQTPSFSPTGKLLVDDISLDTVLNSVQDLSSSTTVDIYPNPLSVDAYVTIQNPTKQDDYIFTVYNLLGEEVTRVEPKNRSFTIHRNNLSCGIYFYKLLSGNALVSSGKLLVE